MKYYKYYKYACFNSNYWLKRKMLIGKLKKESDIILKEHPEYDRYAKLLEENGMGDAEYRKFCYYYDIIERHDTECVLKEHPEWVDEFNFFCEKYYNQSKSTDEEYRRFLGISMACGEIMKNYELYMNGKYTPNWREEEEKKRIEKKKQERPLPQNLIPPIIECPYCHSTNTVKIGTISRSMSVAATGLASGKIGKQWQCLKCKSFF